MELLGRRIAECRKNKQLTQDELALRLGVTPQALSKWERSQSLPDISLLKELCGVLGVSADYLLGTQQDRIVENGNERMQDEIWKLLRNSIEPLELTLGVELAQVIVKLPYIDRIFEVRRRLAQEGILMPIVRVRDQSELAENAYQILSYGKVLASGLWEGVEDASCDKVFAVLEETVHDKYAKLLEPDLVKKLVDNLQIKYPALIRGLVPEKISYGMLTEVLQKCIEKGIAIAYLPKILERLERVLRVKPEATAEELVERLEVLCQ